MNEEEIFDDNFFVFDSDHLSDVESRFIGYAIGDGCIYDSHQSAHAEIPEEVVDGVFIVIRRTQDEITLRQDFIGCFGLYVFEQAGYFAISNSLWLLADHVKRRYRLSVNRDYAHAMFAFDLCSHSLEETIFNEIRLVPRNMTLRISLAAPHIEYRLCDYQEDTIPLDSEEGMAVIDAWFSRWTGVIRQLKHDTNNISVDLSGGMDSRITMLLFLGANIDLSEVRVNSATNNLHGHAEDYAIASAIAEKYGFSLNQGKMQTFPQPFTERTTLRCSFLTKLGSHKQMYWERAYRRQVEYHFTGQGGETRRGYWHEPLDRWLRDMMAPARTFQTADVAAGVRRVLQRSIDKIHSMECFRGGDDCLGERIYAEARTRQHYGKESVESFLANTMKLMPLPDHYLRKIDLLPYQDHQILYCVLMQRYAPGLLSFPIEGGRKFSEETIERAAQIVKRYPFHHPWENAPKVSFVGKTQKISEPTPVGVNQPDAYLLHVFHSGRTKALFEQSFSAELYERAAEYARREKYFPLTQVYVVLALVRALEDAALSRQCCPSMEERPFQSLLESDRDASLDFYRYLQQRAWQRLHRARIDIKNWGNDGQDVMIETDDPALAHFTPRWFGRNGRGHQLESIRGALRVKLTAIHEGRLSIDLRGIDCADKERGGRVPVWIDYTSCVLDGEELLTAPRPSWHDDPFRIRRDVEDGESIELQISWKMHGYPKDEFLHVLEEVMRTY